MIDELVALKRYRDDVPGPTSEARHQAATAIARRAELEGSTSVARGGRRRRWLAATAGAALVAACAAAAVVLPRSSSPTTTIHYRAVAPADGTNGALARTAVVLRARAGALGLTHPRVVVTGDEIGVRIDAHQITPSVLTAIGADATLYLRPVICGLPAYQASDGGGRTTTAVPGTCPSGYRYGSGSALPPSYPAGSTVPTTTPAADRDHPADPVVIPAPPGATSPRYLLGPVVADGSVVRQAHASRSSNGSWNVTLTLTPSGVQRLDAVSGEEAGRAVAFDYDGTVVTAPTLESQSFSEGVQISGNFTEGTATALAIDLTYGALPVPLTT